jgi:hypothetical protein
MCMPSQLAPVRGTHCALLLQKNCAPQSPSPAHDALHAVAPHAYAEHATMDAVGHAPLPSHSAASTALPIVQEASRHVTSLPTKPWHDARSMPSQAFPLQGLPGEPDAHAGRPS